MKTLFTFALCLLAVVANAANPSTKSFRAAGGLIVTSNDITGIITYDGSGISSPTGGVSASSVSNIVLNNGTRIAPGANVTVATNLTASNTIYTVTSTSPGSGSTNLGVGQSLFLDAAFGNDATAQRTNMARPFLTASNAVYAMVAGDTLVVRGGTYLVHPLADSYDASLLISNKNDIAIRGEPDSVFALSSLRGDEFGWFGSMMKLSRCTNVLIDGLTFRGLRTNALVEQHFAIQLDQCKGVKIRNCKFYDWQNQAITCLSLFTTGEDYEVSKNEFYDIGGTNTATLVTDGAAISLHATNTLIDGNLFVRCLREAEVCCSALVRGFTFVNNVSDGNYFQCVVLESAGIQDVLIANNYVYGYSTTLPQYPSVVNEARFIITWGMSNAVIRDNYVFGMNDFAWIANQGVDLLDVQFLDNTFKDSVYSSGIHAIGLVAESTVNRRMTIKGNKFINHFQNAIRYGGLNGLIEGNQFIDCNGIVDPTGVLSIGSRFASENVNTTNCRIINNQFEATTAVALTTGIVVYASSSTNSIWGNEISRNIQGAILDLGVGTLTMPVNILASGAMLYSDTNSRLARVTMGSGVAFNPTTGTLTATGGSGGSAITSINEFTNSEVVFGLLTNAFEATIQVPHMNAYAGGVDFHFPWAGPATSGPLSSNDWQRFDAGGSGASTNFAFDATQFTLVNGTNVVIESGALTTNLFVHESFVVTNASGLHALSASGTVVSVLTNTSNPGTFRVGRYGGKAMQYDGSGNTLKIFGTSAQTTFQLDGTSGDQTNAGTLGVAGAALLASTVSIPVGAVSNYVWTCTNATTGMGEWRAATGGGGGGAFGSDGLVQYANNGTNKAEAAFIYDESDNTLSVTSLVAQSIAILIGKGAGNVMTSDSLGYGTWSSNINVAGSITATNGIYAAGPGAGLVGFGTNYYSVGAVSSNSFYEFTPTNALAGVVVSLPVVAGVTNQRATVALGNGQILTHNGTTYVASNQVAGAAGVMTQTNFVLNTLYTNTTTTLITVRTFLTEAAVNGVSSVELMWSPSGGVGWTNLASSAMSTLLTGLAAQVTNSIAAVLTNLGSYYFTNTSSGDGNSAGLVTGTGQITTMGVGPAGPTGATGPSVTNFNAIFTSALIVSNTATVSNIVATAPGSSIFGETNGGNATAGYIGEYISSAVTNITVGPSAANTNVTSIALTPGDWDVTGVLHFIRNGVTFSATGFYVAVSPTSGNSFAGEQAGNNAAQAAAAHPNTFTYVGLSVPDVRVSIPTNATYYLKGYIDTFASGSPQMSGRISARRVR